MHLSRGQALIETALFIPLLLVAMGGIFWAGQSTIVYERMQTSLRYAGEVAQPVNIAVAQSVNTLYTVAHGGNPAPLPCMTAAPSFYDASQVQVPNMQATVHRAAMFVADDVGTRTCTQQFFSVSGHGLTRDLLVSGTYVATSARPRSFLTGFANVLPGAANGMALTAESTFFQSPTLAMILQAYPPLRKAAKASLVDASQSAKSDPTQAYVVTPGNWNAPAPTAPLTVNGNGVPQLPLGGFTPNMPGPAPVPPSAPAGSGIEGSGNSGNGVQQTDLDG